MLRIITFPGYKVLFYFIFIAKSFPLQVFREVAKNGMTTGQTISIIFSHNQIMY